MCLVPGQQYSYAYYDIGNRLSSKSGGNETGMNLRSTSYSPNLLNQYGARTVPGYLEVLGEASAATTVTVNGGSTYRKGPDFRNELVASNSGGAWPNVAVTAVNGGTTVGRNGSTAYVAPATESFTQDLDGNLTQDARWVYTWDAENRLISMQSQPSVPDAQTRKLVFDCDWLIQIIK